MHKPMKASHLEHLERLRFPVLGSPKLDGIRAMVQEGVLVSRNLKPIQNEHTRKLFSLPQLEGLDGELIFGPPHAPNVFNVTSSAVMSYGGKPEVRYFIFDKFSSGNFTERLAFAKSCISKTYRNLPNYRIGNGTGLVVSCLKLLPHVMLHTPDELLCYEAEMVDKGYEGIMIRDPEGPYKQGRSTEREGWLLKVKRFRDSEARILGLQEEMHNSNEATRELSGKLKRSKTRDGLLGKGRLGSLFCEDIYSGVKFNMSGFPDWLKEKMWADPDKYIGKIVCYKFFPVGVKDKPRHPNFKGFRDPSDLD